MDIRLTFKKGMSRSQWLLVTVMLAMLMPTLVMAEPVDKDAARQKALEFVKVRKPVLARGAQQGLSLALTNDSYHVFNVGDGDGFVMVSGDDCVGDILGYSDSGAFNAEAIPAPLRAWLAGYAEQIALMKANGVTTDTYTPNKAGTRGTTKSSIAPLLTSKWGQSAPYNQWTPDQNPTGYVATAMAQVMYYWYKKTDYMTALEKDIPTYESRFRTTLEDALTAPKTFDWANMKDEYNSDNSDKEIDAVAYLMEYAGYSVKTQYHPTCSRASVNLIAPALTTYFGYKSACHIYNSSYTYEDWQQLIYTDLAAGRPVIYGGESTDIRIVYEKDDDNIFVCDGYDEGDYFHFNWGWDGNGNGYYKLRLCNPKSPLNDDGLTDGGYYMNQTAICCIHPTETVSLPLEPIISPEEGFIGLDNIEIPTLNVGETVDLAVTLRNKYPNRAVYGEFMVHFYNISTINEHIHYYAGSAKAQIAPGESVRLIIPTYIHPQIASGEYQMTITYNYFDSEKWWSIALNRGKEPVVTFSPALPNLTGTVDIKDSHGEIDVPLPCQLSGMVATLPVSDQHLQWQISKNGEDRWEDIAGATGTTYSPQASDAGKYVRIKIKATGYHGELVSDRRYVTYLTVKGSVTYADNQPSPGNNLTYQLNGLVSYIEASLIRAQWQYSFDGHMGWWDMENENGQSYQLKTEDVGRYFRVRIWSTYYDGYLYSTPIQCVKWNCTKTPTTPKVENSTYYNKIVVTNPETYQEYIILDSKKAVNTLTEDDWKDAKIPETGNSVLPLGGTVNATNYVYTRVKETETTLAGTDVRMAAAYFGENVYTQDIELSVYRMDSNSDPVTMTQDGDDYYAFLGDVIMIRAKPVPANATNFSGIYYDQWINNSKSGTFYADYKCTKALESGKFYKVVYFKPLKTENYIDISAQYTKGYNDIARDAVNLHVSDADGRWLASSISAMFEVGKGEVTEGLEYFISPGKATLQNSQITLLTETGKAPVVTINVEKNTFNVDASLATKGKYWYQVSQNGVEVPFGLSVNVTTPPVEEIRLLPDNFKLDCGQSQQLEAQLNPVGAEEEITWSSSDESVATVSSTGVVTVKNNASIGATATITAKVGDLTATSQLTVPGVIYDLYLAGNQVTSRNMNNLTEMIAGLSDEAKEKYNSGDMEISFNGDVLRLKNAIIDATGYETQGMTLGIEGLTVVIEGNCSLKSKYAGLKVARSATILGDGTLTLNGDMNGILFDGSGFISSDDELVKLNVDNTEIMAIGGECGIKGKTPQQPALELNNATVYAKGPDGAIRDLMAGLTFGNSYISEPTGAEVIDGSVMLDGKLATETKILPFISGDANNDGKVDEDDVTLVVSHIMGEVPDDIFLQAADANKDGKVNATDVVWIRNIILGKPNNTIQFNVGTAEPD